jgi:hypothetical protein
MKSEKLKIKAAVKKLFAMFGYSIISRKQIDESYPEDINLRHLAANIKYQYGFCESKRTQKPIDQSGEKLPWFCA